MKRVSAFILAVLLFIPFMSLSSFADNIFEKFDPPIELTSVKELADGIQFEDGDSIDYNIWTRGYEADLGIKVSYLWSVPSTEYLTKLNVAISTDVLPDIIPIPTGQLRLFKLLVDTGVATDMTDILEQYGSAFTKEMIAADNNVAFDQVTVDGRLMALPYIAGNVDGASMLWIRKDWMDNLGFEAPKTIDDLVALARAFKENDPDNNGEDDTFGLIMDKALWGGFGALIGFTEGYGAYHNGWLELEDGTLGYGAIQPEMRDALERMAAIYAEGLLDPEFSVKDSGKLAEMTTAGTAGLLYGQHWIPFWPLQSTKDANPDSDWRPYPIPTLDGSPAQPMVGGSANTVFVINSTCAHPEGAMRIYDYFFAKDCALAGDTFDPEFHADDTRKYNRYQYATMSSTYPLQNLFIHQGVMRYFNDNDQSMLENYWVADNIAQNQKYEAGDNTFWMAHAWSGPTGAFAVLDQYVQNNQLKLNGYIKADTETMTEKGATLDKMREEVFTKIIMGVEPIEAFDTFVDNWLNMGGSAVTAEVNAAR
jgi:putative aldouronate transport system substrate-binding protein